MEIICEPANYDAVALTVGRQGPGVYTLDVWHRHEGARGYCLQGEVYRELSWDEVLTLLDVCADGRRPGMHPDGWEQMKMWD